MQKHQNTQPATSAPVAVPQDETKAMLQQLLQGQQLQGKALNQTAESVKRQQGTLHGKTDKNPKECNAVELSSGKQLSKPGTNVGTNSPGPEQPAEAVRSIPESVPAREYTPQVPYPIPAKATRKDREEMKCKKMLEDLTVQLPLMDVIQMMPSMRSFMKGLISGKISEESKFMTVSKECSAVLQNRQIKKRGDPGKFVLSIQIGKTVFSCSLVDLGSSNKEHDRSKSVNSIDDLAAKVDQLLKGNQSQVFIMEEAAPEKSAGDLAFDAEISGDDQQEVSYVNGQEWQLNVRNNPQLFWPKQDKLPDPAQSNQGQYAGYQKNYQPRTYVLSQPQNNPPQMQKHQNTQPGKQKESELPPANTPAAEKEREPIVGTNSPGQEQPAKAVRPIPEHVSACKYTPKVPYPVPSKATRKDREEMKCRKMLEDLTVQLPLMDAIQMMPSRRSFMKGLISGKISEESEFMTVSNECKDPLELALVRAEAEQSVENIDADGMTFLGLRQKVVGSSGEILTNFFSDKTIPTDRFVGNSSESVYYDEFLTISAIRIPLFSCSDFFKDNSNLVLIPAVGKDSG
ncbi:hypothetical protein DY000_02042542 [Brassica cretica]|uniref:Uncharacterized protein n=1 Tax=Brassica cretica TaxID=69181 RepID=A0ABQ7BMG9_BRACR|nr:hypothetical protein DY000_02042542 [Brassica cretica]